MVSGVFTGNDGNDDDQFNLFGGKWNYDGNDSGEFGLGREFGDDGLSRPVWYSMDELPAGNAYWTEWPANLPMPVAGSTIQDLGKYNISAHSRSGVELLVKSEFGDHWNWARPDEIPEDHLHLYPSVANGLGLEASDFDNVDYLDGGPDADDLGFGYLEDAA